MYSSIYPETQTAEHTILYLNPVPNMDRLLRTKQCMDIIISSLKQMMCWKIIGCISKIYQDEAVTVTIYKYVNLP